MLNPIALSKVYVKTIYCYYTNTIAWWYVKGLPGATIYWVSPNTSKNLCMSNLKWWTQILWFPVNHQEEDVVESLEVSAVAIGDWCWMSCRGFPTCLGGARFFSFLLAGKRKVFHSKKQSTESCKDINLKRGGYRLGQPVWSLLLMKRYYNQTLCQ